MKSVAAGLAMIGRILSGWDWLVVIGGGLVVAGLAAIHWPTAMIFAGGTLAMLGLWGAWAETKSRRARPEANTEAGTEK